MFSLLSALSGTPTRKETIYPRVGHAGPGDSALHRWFLLFWSRSGPFLCTPTPISTLPSLVHLTASECDAAIERVMGC